MAVKSLESTTPTVAARKPIASPVSEKGKGIPKLYLLNSRDASMNSPEPSTTFAGHALAFLSIPSVCNGGLCRMAVDIARQ